jgi:hypothetical protein
MKNLNQSNFLSLIESKKQILKIKHVEKIIKILVQNVSSVVKVGNFIAL